MVDGTDATQTPRCQKRAMMPQAQTGKTKASESTKQCEDVILYVSSDCSDRTLTFKMKASQTLQTLMRVFCHRQGLEVCRTVTHRSVASSPDQDAFSDMLARLARVYRWHPRGFAGTEQL